MASPLVGAPPSRVPWMLSTILLLGGAGYGAYRGYLERARLLAQITEAQVAASNAKTQLVTVEKQLELLEAERADLMAERDGLTRRIEVKTSELAELRGTFDKLNEQMEAEIAAGDIQLTQSGGKLRVGLVDKILFDSGDAAISKRGEGVLARVGAVLATIEDRQIQVSGHTDTARISEKLQAQYPTNWELSVARATNVVRFLQEKASVPADRLVASGYGQYEPIASNRTPRGRSRNRRIEILLTPSLAPKRIASAKLKARAAAPHESKARKRR